MSELGLAADVPRVELNVLVLESFHVEADGWDGVDDFSELHLVQDGGLACGIETDHEDSHFLGSDHAFPNFAKQ